MSYSQHYLVRSCDFVRLQVFYIASAVAIISFYLLWQSGNSGYLYTALTALLTMALQGKWIFPYTWLAKKEVKTASVSEDHSVRIMSANVLMSNHNSEQLISLVDKHQPDLLITLESDSWWENKLAVLKKNYPYYIECPKDNRYGMHLYSKFKNSWCANMWAHWRWYSFNSYPVRKQWRSWNARALYTPRATKPHRGRLIAPTRLRANNGR